MSGIVLETAEALVLCFSVTSDIPPLCICVVDTDPLSLSDATPIETPRGKSQLNVLSQAPLVRWVLTLSFLVATVAMGLYAM